MIILYSSLLERINLPEPLGSFTLGFITTLLFSIALTSVDAMVFFYAKIIHQIGMGGLCSDQNYYEHHILRCSVLI